ncbi:MAG: glycosyltransferase [Pirellulales bacterium]
MLQPEIAVLISTYQRPHHLRRSLLSLANQREVAERMEVVVTDDGSPEASRPVVEAFARTVDFPVHFTTHQHAGFRLSVCRNEGIAVSKAPYLLMSDGDCVFPPDHVKWHLAYRRPGRVVVGDCFRLDRAASEHVADAAIRDGVYPAWISSRERRRLAAKAFRGMWYHLLRLPMRPRVTGCNIGVWRSDLERVNGFDENYVGWGLEDRDLQRRLSRLGLRFKSILYRTAPCHLWHEPAPTFARNNVGTKNLEYYRRDGVPTRCQFGLEERIAASSDCLCEDRVLVSGGEADSEATAEGPRVLRFPTLYERESLRKAA